MAAPKKTAPKNPAGGDMDVKEMMEPVMKTFGVKWDSLVGAMVMNLFKNLETVVPQYLNILADKELYDEIVVIAKEIGLESGTSCGCVTEKLIEDKSMCEKFLDFFLKRLSGQMDPNVGDDVTKETVAKYVESFHDRMDSLTETVGPEAYQKSLDWINNLHIFFSLISLAISWKFLWDSVWKIKNATKTIETIRTDLDKLRRKKINPIFQLLNQTKLKGSISRQDYQMCCVQIESAVDLLNEWKKQVVAEKENMQNNAANNTIAALVMGISAFSTFGLNAVDPSKALQAIGVLQTGTAVAHAGVAILSAATYKKLATLEGQLQTEIEKLLDAKTEMAKYLGQDPIDAYSWDNDQVVEWVQGIDAEIAKKFKEVGVEGADLLDMDDATLDSIGVGLFHRKKLLRKINELNK